MPDPSSVVAIVNMALTRIGSTQTITALSDTSNEAAQGSLWYPICRDALLREFQWPWATKYAALALVSATSAPVNQEWVYSYRYPTDCLFIRRILPPPQQAASVTLTSNQSITWTPLVWRQDSDPYPIPFEPGQDSIGRLIYTGQVTAYVKYTVQVTDVIQFAPDFSNLLAWRLATELAYGLAVSDARRDYAQKKYDEAYATARANALNEQQRDNPYVTWNSEFVRGRFNQ